MEQSPFWEAIVSSSGQATPRIFWNPKVHYSVNKSSLSLSYSKGVHLILVSSTMHFNIFSHLCLGLLSGFRISGFPINILTSFLFSIIRAKCPAHLMFCVCINQIIFYEEYKSCTAPFTLFSASCRFFPLRQVFISACYYWTPGFFVPWYEISNF